MVKAGSCVHMLRHKPGKRGLREVQGSCQSDMAYAGQQVATVHMEKTILLLSYLTKQNCIYCALHGDILMVPYPWYYHIMCTNFVGCYFVIMLTQQTHIIECTKPILQTAIFLNCQCICVCIRLLHFLISHLQ